MTGNVSKKLAINAQNGKDGVGIARWYTENDSLFLVLTDNRTIEIGNLKGPGATVTIGSVETVEYNEGASVENVGTAQDAILNIKIPAGKDGDITDEYVSMYQSVGVSVDAAQQAANIASDAADRAEEAASSIDGTNLVHKTGAETIDGLKTFRSSVCLNKISNNKEFFKLESDKGVGISGIGEGSSVGVSSEDSYIYLSNPCGSIWLEDGEESTGITIETTEGDVRVASAGKFLYNDKEVATRDEALKTLTLDEFHACKTDGAYVVLKDGLRCVGIMRTYTNRDLIYRYLWDGNSILLRTTYISTGEVDEDYTNQFHAAYADEAGYAEGASYAAESGNALNDKMGNVIHDTYATKAELSKASAPLKASVDIPGGIENWTAENVYDANNNVIGVRYGKRVNVNNATITPYSKVDLQLTSEQTAVLYGKGLAFVAENDNGVVTVYCIGNIPEDNYTFQVVVTEVVVNA